MKKIVLLISVVLLLALSACSLQQYLPDNNQSPVIVLNDTFAFTNGTVADDNQSIIAENMSSENTSSENKSQELSDDANIFSTVTVTEGEIASLAFLSAKDPDGDSVEYAYSKPFTSQGLWQTNDGDEGKYLVTVTASDGLLSTTENIQVIVLPSNKGPVIDCPTEISVKEGELVDLGCTIYDREGDKVSYSITGFMDNMTYQTTYKDAGVHTVVIEATDGNKTNIKIIKLTVENVNRPPEVKKLEPINVKEGDVVKLNIDTKDPDGDKLVIVYPFPFDKTGVWQTKKGDAGNYELDGFVSDGTNDVEVPISINVEKLNVPPTIDNLDEFENIEVSEGDTIVLNVVASDEDGDNVTVNFSGFMTTKNYTTTYDDAGNHTVTITVSDKTHKVSQDINVEVLNKDRPPVFVVN